PEPCGTCSFCREIAAGTSTDVQEIDAASRTSVDDVREIVEAVRYAPTPGKWRIFVVDEVHMLSAAAFNALLKTLEEPPPRSLFVFATTNPEKIPFTVVSRCQRYDLRRLAAAEVVARLRDVAAAEGLRLSETSLLRLARAGEGSLRDALTLLDQVVAVGGAEVGDAEVAAILDLIDPQLVNGILRACLERDPAGALAACARAGEAGIDAKRLGATLVQRLRDLVVLRLAPDHPGLVEASDAELAELRALAESAEPARLRRMFRALVREQEDLAWAPEPFAVLEMALVRLATLPAGDDVGELLARLDALERRLASGGGAGPGAGGGAEESPSDGGRARGRGAGPARRTAPAEPEAAPSQAAGVAPESAGVAPESAVDAPEGAVELETGDPDADVDPVPAPAAPASAASAAEPPLESVFDRLRVFAQRENRGLFAALEGGRVALWDGERLRVVVHGGIGARRLFERRAELAAVCERFFDRPVRLELEIESDSGADEAVRGRQVSQEVNTARRREALNHPALNAALEILDAEIVEIRPLGGPS
ncbi:MAG TPA: DNA polymerase III subunit gamma/tau, partial [Myxococcota bacterium]|nr:DNA polymerase III subunit gamma/tau [Myxococcota bacterium]